MNRHAYAWKLLPGKINDFRKGLGRAWPRATALMDAAGMRNFSLWTAEDLVFGYYETDAAAIPKEQSAAFSELLTELSDTFTWVSVPGGEMRLMYHDFGVVRENKELIRHRVFMTKLKPGCEEEYKARHDALVASRGDAVDPGPDSNFSIWCAGGYIFGYNEIDTTMETEPTPESRAADIAWETRQLEIMDWITNDVDWITGEVHAQVRRLASHSWQKK